MMPPFLFNVGGLDARECKYLILIFVGSVTLMIVAMLLFRSKKRYDAAYRALTGMHKKHDTPEIEESVAGVLTL